jgi:hypothetical protein
VRETQKVDGLSIKLHFTKLFHALGFRIEVLVSNMPSEVVQGDAQSLPRDTGKSALDI